MRPTTIPLAFDGHLFSIFYLFIVMRMGMTRRPCGKWSRILHKEDGRIRFSRVADTGRVFFLSLSLLSYVSCLCHSSSFGDLRRRPNTIRCS